MLADGSSEWCHVLCSTLWFAMNCHYSLISLITIQDNSDLDILQMRELGVRECLGLVQPSWFHVFCCFSYSTVSNKWLFCRNNWRFISLYTGLRKMCFMCGQYFHQCIYLCLCFPHTYFIISNDSFTNKDDFEKIYERTFFLQLM